MRLWHTDLLDKLPKQWLMGQHRECCALRGKGWGKKHATVDYVFAESYTTLYLYHMKVIELLESLNVNISDVWKEKTYRGRKIGWVTEKALEDLSNTRRTYFHEIYPQHNTHYYQECINNLKKKGIEI